jgi:hypothetical protein
MARYRAEIDTGLSRERAFEYLSDFANVKEWDPGVVDARRLTDASTAEGSPATEAQERYEVTVSMAGRPVTLPYRTVEKVWPERIVLRAQTRWLLSEDRISFSSEQGRTRILYEAEVRPLGPLALLEPLLARGLRRAGDRARDGLRRRLAEIEAQAGPPA